MALLKPTLVYMAAFHVVFAAGLRLHVDIERHLKHFATHRYPSQAHKEAREQAKEYIISQFEECGLRVDQQGLKAYAAPIRGERGDYNHYKKDKSQVRGVNIIGLSGPEREAARSVVVVGAAYDTDGVGSPLRDNGAGVAVLLETARLYQASMFSPHLATLFVAFDLSTDRYGSKTLHDSGSDGGGGGGGGLPGAYSLVQDYLRSFVNQNTSRVGGAIVLGPLMNVNPENDSQVFEPHLKKLFPAAHKEVAERGNRGDFVALVSGGPSEAERTLAKEVMASFKKVGGRLVEFRVANDSHSVLPPSLPTREATYFWQSTIKGRKSPLPAILLTDTEMNRVWPKDAPPLTQLTEAQRDFLDTTVASLVHFLVQRQPDEKVQAWVEVGLVTTLMVSCGTNLLLLVYLYHLCSSPTATRSQGDSHTSSETLALLNM